MKLGNIFRSLKIITFFVMLVGCSPSEKNSNININRLEVQSSLDFGSLERGSPSVIQTLTIKNDEELAVVVSPVVSGGPFSIVYSSCGNLGKGKSCVIKVLMNSNGAVGNYLETLSLGQSSVSLEGQIVSSSGVSDLKIYENDIEIISSSYGSLSGSQSVLKTFVIKNEGQAKSSEILVSLNNSNYSIIQNSCTRPLNKNGSCSIKVLFSASGKLNQEHSAVLSINSLSLNLTAMVTTTESVPENLAFMDGITEVENIDLGEIPEKLFKSIIIKNKNMVPSSELSVSLDSPHYLKVFDSCSGKVLKGQETCLVKLYIANKPDGSYPLNFTVNSKTLPIAGAIGYRLDSIELAMADYLLVNECHPVMVAMKIPAGTDFISESPISLTSNLQLYSDLNCSNANSTIEAGISQKQFYIKPVSLGSLSLNVSVGSITKSENFVTYSPIQLSNQTITTENTATLAATGGHGSYSYQLVSGVGSLQGSNFTSEVVGSAIVKAIDSLGNEATSTITVNAQLTLSLGTCSSAKEQVDCTPSVSGGVAPFSYSVDRGTVVNQSTGSLYSSCDGSNCQDQITVEDSLGNIHSINFTMSKVYTSCSNVVARNGSGSNGFYDIDFDGYRTGQSLMNVRCDFTTAGGPYLVVISSEFSNQEQIDNLNLLGNTVATAAGNSYSRNAQGVTWASQSFYIIKSHIPVVSGNYISFRANGRTGSNITLADRETPSHTGATSNQCYNGTYKTNTSLFVCSYGLSQPFQHYLNEGSATTVGQNVLKTTTGLNQKSRYIRNFTDDANKNRIETLLFKN